MQAVSIFDFLGMRFSDWGDGWAELTMLAGPGNQNLYGIVHGGAWLVVADSTMGGAFATVCAPDERIITGQLDFRWLRPLDGDRLVARGTVIRRGRTLSHAKVELFDAAGRQVGAGSGTYVIQPPA